MSPNQEPPHSIPVQGPAGLTAAVLLLSGIIACWILPLVGFFLLLPHALWALPLGLGALSSFTVNGKGLGVHLLVSKLSRVALPLGALLIGAYGPALMLAFPYIYAGFSRLTRPFWKRWAAAQTRSV